MSRKNTLPTLAFLLGVLLWTGPTAFLSAQDPGGDVEIASDISPSTIRLGASARYSIHLKQTNRGNFDRRSTPNGTVPDVPGLEIDYLGQSTSTRTSFSNITGTTRSETLTLNYQVVPEQAGNFRIPEFEILFEGNRYRVPAVRLNVLDPSGAPDSDRPPLLKLELLFPQDKVFVGQTLKTNLQLYVLGKIPNIRTDYPTKIGDAWAEGDMADNQTRSRGAFGGYEYDIYSRPLLLTPLKAGEQDLLYEMNVQALLPVSGSIFDNPQPDPRSPFNDPFFRQFNFRMDPQLQYQNRKVQTEPLKIEVHPLPEENRPPAFSGAIGEFTLKAFPGTNTVKAGDPVTLRLQVAGQGNFDRILPPTLDLGDQWRSYEPETSFRQGDALGFSGVKNFDYTLIPLDDAISAIPEVSIAYFDPRTEAYEVLTTGRIPLTVEENPNLQLDRPDTLPDPDAENAPSPRFFELALNPGQLRPFTTPLLLDPRFLAAQALPLLALIAFVGIRRYQIRNERDLALQRRKQAEKRLLALQAEIGEAARSGETATLYRRFLQGYRLVLSKKFGPRVEAATWEELQPFLDETGIEPDLRQEMESFFREGEAVAFSSQSASPQNLVESRARWENSLRRLDQVIRSLS